MSLCNTILGKEIDALQNDDLTTFFKLERHESSVLEFKSGQVSIEDVYSEIASFANTEGGILIIGAPLETRRDKGKHEIRFCQGDLTYSTFASKDWLLQKIASQVVPYPPGIRIQEFRFEQGRCFVVEVPQSPIPPHQVSSSGSYYIRLGTEMKPAPHGLVQALFQKRRSPILKIGFRIKKQGPHWEHATFLVMNEARTPATGIHLAARILGAPSVTINSNRYTTSNLKKELVHLSIFQCPHDLVHGLAWPSIVQINHDMKPYALVVDAYASSTETVTSAWLYDPKTETTIVLSGELDIDQVHTQLLEYRMSNS